MEQYKTREKEEYRHLEAEQETEETSSGSFCTFCGAILDEDDNFCPECGSPRAGITCPECGTLNHGSFCSKCNAPLDDLAREAIRRAKEDPNFREAEKLASELIELEELIERLKTNPGDGNKTGQGLDTSSAVTDEMKTALQKYQSLFKNVATIKVKEPETKKVSTPATSSATDTFSVNSISLAEAVERYKAVASKLQAKLDAMLPDPSATPQEQRNFFSARKIRTARIVTGDKYWICNYCGCKHHQPSECYKPWMGGKWIVDTKIDGTNETTLFD